MFDNLKDKPQQWQTIFIVLWISFLLAIVATGVVFSIVDPVILRDSIQFMNQSSVGIYSMGFLLFWFFLFFSGYFSCLFTRTHET